MPEPRNLLDWRDIPADDWHALVDRARHHERTRGWTNSAHGQSIGLLFFNPSLRTRTSMELAAAQLGAASSTIVPGSGTWGFAWSPDGEMDGDEAEHIEEAIGVLSRYYSAIGVRLFASMTDLDSDRRDARLAQIQAASEVPVLNLESAFWHPCQELADAATVHQQFDGRPAGRKFVLTWAYHPRALPMAVPNSALMAAARSGMEVVVARPEGYALDESVIESARAAAGAAGGSVTEVADQFEATADADVVYAKAWAGRDVYTDPDAEARRRGDLKQWRVTPELMSTTNNAAFMHCLPVRRNVVVDTDVLKSPAAVHLKQAEYRLHAQKAILEHLWELL